MARRGPQDYSSLQITLHWILALLVLFQLVFGESMTIVQDAADGGDPASAADQSLAAAHYWVGLSILALVAIRLVLRLVQGAPAPLATGAAAGFAKLAHWIFYALLFAIPVTGLLAIYVSPDFGDVHSAGKPALIALIVVHLLGSLYHHFKLKDATLGRMVPFMRR